MRDHATMLYDPTLVDQQTKIAILDLLFACRSLDLCDPLSGVLHTVTWTLLSHSPREAYHWYSGQSPPLDMKPLGWYLDSRGIEVWTWENFARVLPNIPPRVRRPDGRLSLLIDDPERARVLEALTTPLLNLPFRTALPTWFAAWEAWAGKCNLDQVLAQMRADGWRGQRPRRILKHVAAWVRYRSYQGGW